MKYIKKVIALPAISLILSATTPHSSYIKVSTLQVYGPFTGEDNIEVYFTSSHPDYDIQGTANVYNNKNGALLFSRSISIHSPLDTPFLLDLAGRMTSSGVLVDLYFRYERKYTFDEEFVLYPPKRNEFSSSIKKIKMDGCLFQIKDNELITDEEYDFTSTNSFISSNDGNRLTVSETLFNYYPINGYRYDHAYLVIVDYENVFPAMTSRNGVIQIPLNITTNEDEISFEFSRTMYVNRSTLEMSDRKIKGFEETDDFFIPLGKEEILSKDEFKIVIYESGYNLSKVTIPLEYYSYDRLFGECGKSDYCIHGGIRE